MPDLMRNQLGAYLDGELHGSALQAMQVHLEICPECQEELQALAQLSQSLRSAPLPDSLPAAGTFAARLAASLPPQPTRPATRRNFSANWIVPLGLLASLAITHAAVILSSAWALSGIGNPLSQAASWVELGPGQNLWLSAVWAVLQSGVSAETAASLQLGQDFLRSLQTWFEPLRWQLALALVYLAWLVVWWSSRQGTHGTRQPVSVLELNGF